MKIKICLPLFLCVFASLTLAAGERYALFVIDQGESMNQPTYSPRLERALDQAVSDVHMFASNSAAERAIPYFKIVTFNGGQGYFEHTDWIPDVSEALEVLEQLRFVRGAHFSPLDEALGFASEDLSTLSDVQRDHRLVFVYTDGPKSERAVDGLHFNQAGSDRFLNRYEIDADLNWQEMAGVAVWKTLLYEDRVEDEASHNPYAAPMVRELEVLAGKPLSLLHMEADPMREAIENQKAQTMQDRFEYYLTGQNTDDIYGAYSADAVNWNAPKFNNGAESSQAVSAVHLNGVRYAFYKGRTTSGLWYSYNKGIGTTWSSQSVILNSATNGNPAAIVSNNKIRVYFLSDNGASINYIESVAISSSGAVLSWSSETVTTLSPTTTSWVAATYDPSTNQDMVLITDNLYGNAVFGRQGTAPFTLIQTLPSSIVHPTMTAGNNDVFVAYRDSGNALQFMKRSTNWQATRIHTNSTSRAPGIAYNGTLMVVHKNSSNDSIFVTRSFNNGQTWLATTQGAHQTRDGIGALAYNYAVPLSCYINCSAYYVEPFEQVTWTAGASGGNPSYSYQWYVDGYPSGTGSTLTRSFSSTGTYQIELRVTDSSGAVCISYTTINVSSSKICINPCITPI